LLREFLLLVSTRANNPERHFSAGIVPSNKTAYALADIQQAIVSQTGGVPYLGCSGVNHTVLSEVWYFQHVWGSEQFGKYKVIDSTSKSSCNTTQPIWYYERTKTSEREVRLLP
jgi:ribonuclease T2